jgi:SAM-dependent methyltransferase
VIAQQHCQICQQLNWQPLGELCSGVWQKSQQELTREELLFPLGLCSGCGHVQVTVPYTADIFASLYFSNNREPDMWCSSENQQTPYHDMLNFIGDTVLQSQTSVADFGCGAALPLKLMQQQYPNLHYYGFDFNVSACDNNITGIQCNINELDNIDPRNFGDGFSLVLSSHVLEHVLQPIHYLQQLGRFLASDGLLFIEVPDCGDQALACALETTNLVHGQHIHYYTDDSLRQIATLAGFSLQKQAHIRTGEIPRLQMLFKKSQSAVSTVQIHRTAAAAIELRFHLYNSKLQFTYCQIKQLLAEHPSIGLWGIGGDFYILLRTYPELRQALADQRLRLFDYELAGHTYQQQPIRSSSELAGYSSPVIIVPFYAPTRQRMLQLAKNFPCVRQTTD